MASPNNWPSGLNLAGTVFENGPATLQLDGDVWLSGNVQWLDTIDGDNANAGTLPNLPVATFAQAVTNSAANGIIVIGEGSAETLTGSQAISLAGLSIFGCGVGSSRPRYTCAGAVDMWDVGAAGIWIEGIYFPASTAVPTSRVKSNNDSFVMKDCYFECGANDTTRALYMFGGNGSRVEGCSFVVTAERPAIGLHVPNAINDLTVVGCTFDGGSYGWTDYALKVAQAALRVRIIDPTMANHSNIGFTVTGSSYQLYGVESGGTTRVLLTA